MPLSAHAKQRGLRAVYVGGLLQTLFGVRGGRWDDQAAFALHFNEHWVRPLRHEVPPGRLSLHDARLDLAKEPWRGSYWR